MSCNKSSLTCHAMRLHPGQNVTQEIIKYIQNNGLKAAFVMTCCGSITKATIRLANATATKKNEIIELDSRHEVTSLVGTICSSGSFHLHTTLGDAAGGTVSGHVMGNMEVFTTMEIVLGELEDLIFTREMDNDTGFPELVISKR